MGLLAGAMCEHLPAIRRLRRERRRRDNSFPSGLFGEPCWDMLLELAEATGSGRLISITSLGFAAGVPATTSLRRISLLCDVGLASRRPDEFDGRRHLVELTEVGAAALCAYFAALAPPAGMEPRPGATLAQAGAQRPEGAPQQ